MNQKNKKGMENLIEGIKGIVDRYIKNAPFDKTQNGVISAVDYENNIYTVLINGKEYKLYAMNDSLSLFDVGEIVKVVIPQNQPSNMYIAGRAIGNAKNVQNGTNFNDLKTPGIYYQRYQENTTNNTNMPVQQAFSMEVSVCATILQKFITNAGKIYTRNWQNWTNTWTAWKQYVAKSDLLNMIYPVGTIYMSMVNTSPQSFLGGTWAAIAPGRVLVGVNTGDSDFNTPNKSGGAKTITVGQSNLPSRTVVRVQLNGQGGINAPFVPMTGWANTSMADANLPNSQSIKTVPPYLTCYMWRRTA